MASSSMPPRLADNPPSFSMACSSLLSPYLHTIEQAMMAARSALACQGSTVNHQSPWSSDPTVAAPRQNPWRMSALITLSGGHGLGEQGPHGELGR
ncbi:uncharacterized protein LOC123412983 isoform X2 [Hordeum vulgare subsp. vulgare]|nr:uncharacterized protein LOC123412983 isoform X2 [Hordeum vulgare subsp. vulgare]KAI4974840.1 hypothetical protein ZWY2020_048447 [Hordeum vulgare]